MKKNDRKIAIIFAAAICMLLLPALPGFCQNDPDARFRGGSYDGYDDFALIETSTNWTEFAVFLTARSRGGALDGYDMAEILQAKISPRRMVIILH